MKRMNNLSEMRRKQQQQARDKSGHGNSGTSPYGLQQLLLADISYCDCINFIEQHNKDGP
jgi:hypothetical protein